MTPVKKKCNFFHLAHWNQHLILTLHSKVSPIFRSMNKLFVGVFFSWQTYSCREKQNCCWCFTSCDNYVPQWWVELDDELSWLFTNRLSATRYMKVKRMGITELLRRIWLFSANNIKSSESFIKQSQLIVKLNSSLRQIIDSLLSWHFLFKKQTADIFFWRENSNCLK